MRLSFIFTILIFHAANILASASYNSYDYEYENLKSKLEYCSSEFKNFSKNIYPSSYAKTLSQILSLKKENKKCINELNTLQNYIEKKIFKESVQFSINSEIDTFYLQDSSERHLTQNNINISYSGINIPNFVYKISVTKTEEDDYLDGSFISYYSKYNNILTLGKVNYWWSESPNFSLILSNSAKAFPSISLTSNIPKKLDLPVVNQLGYYDYQFFIGRLDSKRAVKNAKFLGMRVGFYPSPKFKFSLFRTAQFGGEGRSESISTLLNLLIGKDNREEGVLSMEDEPGNQLAGIDFSYKLNNRFVSNIFAQFVGEDEAGFLPSRFFYHIAMNKNFLDSRLSFDYLDTGTISDHKNYTYNHDIYLDGYRHIKKPLGASIDADSELLFLSYEKNIYPNSYLKTSIYSGEINKNNNIKNIWSNNAFDVSGINLKLNKLFKNKNEITIEYIYNNFSFSSEDDYLPRSQLVFSFRRFF